TTTLYWIDTSGSPFTYPDIAASGITYNGLAYNQADGYLYANYVVGTNRRLIRIGADGAIVDLGVITSTIADSGIHFNVGEIGPDEHYYVRQAATNNRAWRIDLATRVGTEITLTGGPAGGTYFSDWALYNGMLYGHDHTNGNLYAVDPGSGAMTLVGNTGITSPFGAIFATANGVYGVRNTGGFYKFDLNNGSATLVSSSPPSDNNDSASCPDTVLELPADLEIVKTDGSTTYSAGSQVVY